MKEAYSISQQHSDKRKKKDIGGHDKHIPSLAKLQPGDRVLVRKEEGLENYEITRKIEYII